MNIILIVQMSKLSSDEVKGFLFDPTICLDENRMQSLVCSVAYMEIVAVPHSALHLQGKHFRY